MSKNNEIQPQGQSTSKKGVLTIPFLMLLMLSLIHI